MLRSTASCWVLWLLVRGAWSKGSLGRTRGNDMPHATYTVLKQFPHEKSCFTEGLSLNGSVGPEVFESCGLTGKSYIRRYNLQTGTTIQQTSLERQYFGEGAVLFETSLLVLTYQHRKMLEFDSKTFKVIRSHPFPYGEGWGLTTDGCDLIATTGSEFLFRLRRDPTSGEFQLVNKVKVTLQGRTVRMLNEIEYITPKLWVNEWYTNRIWRVDPFTGICELQIDIGKLYNWGRSSATPNGIAYSPALGEDVLLVTGKLWPNMFALRLNVADLCGSSTPVDQASCPSAPRSACWHGATARAPATTMEPPAIAPPVVATPAVTTPALTPAASASATSSAPALEMVEVQTVMLPKSIIVVSSSLGAIIFCLAGGSAVLIRHLRYRKREMMYRHRLEQQPDDA